MSKIILEQCPRCDKYTKLSWTRFWSAWKRFWRIGNWWCDSHSSITVSEMAEMSLSELKDEDYIMISDVSEKKSKKIKLLTLMQHFNSPRSSL